MGIEDSAGPAAERPHGKALSEAIAGAEGLPETKPGERHLILVDGSGYIFRAYHALPPMTRPDGTPVPGVFGADLAAPVLFQAFARLKPTLTPQPPAPPATLLVSTPSVGHRLKKHSPHSPLATFLSLKTPRRKTRHDRAH